MSLLLKIFLFKKCGKELYKLPSTLEIYQKNIVFLWNYYTRTCEEEKKQNFRIVFVSQNIVEHVFYLEFKCCF